MDCKVRSVRCGAWSVECKVRSVRCGGSLERNARLHAPTCLVSSLWLSYGFVVSLEKCKPVAFDGVKVSKHFEAVIARKVCTIAALAFGLCSSLPSCNHQTAMKKK